MNYIFCIIIAGVLGVSLPICGGKQYQKAVVHKKAMSLTSENKAPVNNSQHKYVLKKTDAASAGPVAPSAQQLVQSPGGMKKVMVTNGITDKMITYMDHWAKPYPSKFNLFVNGAVVKKGQQIEIPVGATEVSVGYECEFKKFGIMYHQEKKEKKVPVAALGSQAEVTFSWYNPDRLDVKPCNAAS